MRLVFGGASLSFPSDGRYCTVDAENVAQIGLPGKIENEGSGLVLQASPVGQEKNKAIASRYWTYGWGKLYSFSPVSVPIPLVGFTTVPAMSSLVMAADAWNATSSTNRLLLAELSFCV